jgi:hypothetical protein
VKICVYLSVGEYSEPIKVAELSFVTENGEESYGQRVIKGALPQQTAEQPQQTEQHEQTGEQNRQTGATQRQNPHRKGGTER